VKNKILLSLLLCGSLIGGEISSPTLVENGSKMALSEDVSQNYFYFELESDGIVNYASEVSSSVYLYNYNSLELIDSFESIYAKSEYNFPLIKEKYLIKIGSYGTWFQLFSRDMKEPDADLSKGWNLKGALNDINVTSFNADCSDIWTFNKEEWKKYQVGEENVTISRGNGYWVNCK